jgi:hypothetical protein
MTRLAFTTLLSICFLSSLAQERFDSSAPENNMWKSKGFQRFSDGVPFCNNLVFSLGWVRYVGSFDLTLLKAMLHCRPVRIGLPDFHTRFGWKL